MGDAIDISESIESTSDIEANGDRFDGLITGEGEAKRDWDISMMELPWVGGEEKTHKGERVGKEAGKEEKKKEKSETRWERTKSREIDRLKGGEKG